MNKLADELRSRLRCGHRDVDAFINALTDDEVIEKFDGTLTMCFARITIAVRKVKEAISDAYHRGNRPRR